MSRFLRVIKVYPPPPSTYSGTMSINHPDERERGERHPISLRAREDNLKGALASSLADSDPLLIRRRANKCWHRGQAGIAGIAGRQAATVHSLVPCLAMELPPVKAVMMRVSTPFPSFVIESPASERARNGGITLSPPPPMHQRLERSDGRGGPVLGTFVLASREVKTFPRDAGVERF